MEDIVRKEINLVYYLSELSIDILKKNNRTSAELDSIKNNPNTIFRLLTMVDENFENKYNNKFSESVVNFLQETSEDLNEEQIKKSSCGYNSLLALAKDFVLEYFENWQLLMEEIDTENFGFTPLYINKISLSSNEDLETQNGNFFVYEATTNGFEIVRGGRKFFVNERKNEKFKKIKGITIESSTHRIKNNRTKNHYNYDEDELELHLDEFAEAILNHEIPENERSCKTFKISWKNSTIKIRPSTSYKRKKR